MKKMTRLVRGVNDLETVNPALAKEFNISLNDGMTPMDIAACSRKKVVWRCVRGHEWEASVYSRNYGGGCPYCAGKRPIVGETDLASVNPALAAELVDELNDGITARNVTAYSHKSLFWRCARNHIWMATVNKRSRGTGCPYCAGKLPIIGETDLATVNPTLAGELADDLNKGITAEKVTAHSNKNLYWRCKRGHVWETTVNARSRGSQCPYCVGSRVIVGENDLATVNPTLAGELADDLNKGITAKDLPAHSNKNLYWRCKRGHVWEAIVYNRSSGTNCPYCAGKRPIVGETDLATVNPPLARELADDLIAGVTAKDLTAHSNKSLSWRCKRGHVWEDTVGNRSAGRGCPYCSGRRPIVGETDLATVNPSLAGELANDLNDGVTAEQVTAHSEKKLFWRCALGHEWEATVMARSYGTGCPYCAGKLPVIGETDLASVYPKLAAELIDELNEGVTAEKITAHSNTELFWKCENGHVFRATVNKRSYDRNCPFCAGKTPYRKKYLFKVVNDGEILT